MSGKFITFEGGEGSGKSTQIKLLGEFLKTRGIDVLLTKEPGGTPLGQNLRRLLVEGDAEKLDAKAEALLFFADRRIHMASKVWPALDANKWVLSDRFADSTMAYQYYAQNKRLSKEDIEMLYAFSVGHFAPDLTLILDINPQIGLARSFKKAETMAVKETRNENRALEFHENLRMGYLEIARQNKERCVVLNANKSVEDLQKEIALIVCKRFGI
ncbi:MAG: dTMP kinase [Alphaproteobacteria bacterium]|nr:dTMP kinase [Alphaproteobacteria bacterium]